MINLTAQYIYFVFAIVLTVFRSSIWERTTKNAKNWCSSLHIVMDSVRSRWSSLQRRCLCYGNICWGTHGAARTAKYLLIITTSAML